MPTVVRKLREAGAVLLGKLQLTEGAFADHHPDDRAARESLACRSLVGRIVQRLRRRDGSRPVLWLARLRHRRSIRFPSAANGNTGLKPTWGRVSRHGCFELAASLDHIGPMCRSATDAAIMLGAIAGADPNDPTTLRAPVPDYQGGDDRDLRGFRIGFDEAYALSTSTPMCGGPSRRRCARCARSAPRSCRCAFPT